MAEAVTLDTTQMARLIDVTPRHIQRLAADGVLTRARNELGDELTGRWEMIANNHAYINHLRTQARLDDTSEATFVSLRNSKMRSEAEMADLRLKELKGELLRADDVAFWVSNTFTAFKAKIRAIPSRLTRLLLGQTNFGTVFGLLKAETDTALNELSHFDSSQFSAASKLMLGVEGNGQQPNDEDTSDSTGNDVAGGFAPE